MNHISNRILLQIMKIMKMVPCRHAIMLHVTHQVLKILMIHLKNVQRDKSSYCTNNFIFNIITEEMFQKLEVGPLSLINYSIEVIKENY